MTKYSKDGKRVLSWKPTAITKGPVPMFVRALTGYTRKADIVSVFGRATFRPDRPCPAPLAG